jgi:hypothetical protein
LHVQILLVLDCAGQPEEMPEFPVKVPQQSGPLAKAQSREEESQTKRALELR